MVPTDKSMRHPAESDMILSFQQLHAILSNHMITAAMQVTRQLQMYSQLRLVIRLSREFTFPFM